MPSLLLASNDSLVAILVALPFMALGAVLFASAHLYVCAPDEVLILTGRGRTLPDGSRLGYRVIKGGRAFRVPVLETAHRLSLIPHEVERRERVTLADGEATFQLEALVKVSPGEPALNRAIERFLGHSFEEIGAVASQTLAGCLSALLARRSAVELDGIKDSQLCDDLRHEGQSELPKIGLQLESLRLTRAS